MVRCAWCGTSPTDENPLTVCLSGPVMLPECARCLNDHERLVQSMRGDWNGL